MANEYEIEDVVAVTYTEEQRIGIIQGIDYYFGKIRLYIKFLDNGEERNYTFEKHKSNRIRKATPSEIVKWRTYQK